MIGQLILLVEDNPDDVDLTLRALKKKNISNEVHVARDGAEALEFLFGEGNGDRHAADLPGLILLDLKLPKVSGIEVLQRIRNDSRTKLLPVVILTSSKEEEDLVRCYESGCNSFIQKPVDFSQFADAVHQLGLYWLLLNASPQQVGG